MSLFGGKKKKAILGPPADPKWVHFEGGRFPKFLVIDIESAGLRGRSVVFVIWHTGQKPGWVYVGKSADLGATFDDLVKDRDILDYQNRGDLHTSWCYLKDEFQEGAVAYLTQALKPKVENPAAKTADQVDLVALYPPGLVPKNIEDKADDAGQRDPAARARARLAKVKEAQAAKAGQNKAAGSEPPIPHPKLDG